MSSKEPVEQEEMSQKEMDNNGRSTVCPISNVKMVLKDVQIIPSTSKSPLAAETTNSEETENAGSLSSPSTETEYSSIEAKETCTSDKIEEPLREAKSSSHTYQDNSEVALKGAKIDDTELKENVPGNVITDVTCTETDDSDSQWTDISDEVTDDETEYDGGEKHDSTGTSINYSYSTPVKDKDTMGNSSGLSEEEKQNFAFISEQLSILNKESTTVNTAIHKSQKKSKKGTPNKHKTDPKKTPRKPTTMSMSSSEAEHRRSVRKRLETTPTSSPKKHRVDVAMDADSADDADTSQDDALQIDERDLDETLDRKARRKGLTAVNVKNIIHELVKNVDVQQMLRNHMNEQLSNMSGSESLAFEPKMTRAKVKEVIEKGVPLQTWPLSPVKKTVVPKKPSILDIDFPEDEEDDEYSPDKDAEDHHESDDDLESMISSHASDLGSPLPPTPSTPSIRTPLRARTPQTEDTETFRSPMSTGSGVSSRRPSMLGQHFKTSMAALEDSSTQGGVTQSDTIAKRTRSKLPLTDTSLTAIEEAFVAPDITPDMYDTQCDDSEWQEFLRSLVKSDTDPVDDDVNDPEFDFLEEAEKLEETEEDFRFDKPFRVSKKELNQLIIELHELFPEPEDEDKAAEHEETTVQESPVEKDPRKTATSSLSKTELEENSLIVSPEERLLIEDQMRKHVQLTTQLFFLCKGSEDFVQMTSTCRQLLRELDIFRCVSMARDTSSYNVCNLQSAIDLVGEDRTWNLSQEAEDASTYSLEETNSNATDSDKESADCCKKYRKKASAYPLLPSQVDVFWNSPVFLYPQLLPRQRLLSFEDASKCRLSFTSGEDNLIALAFEQFHKMKNFRSLMQKYLLPAKSVKQINLRMKNLKSKRTPDNALKFFLKHKKPLPRALVVEAFYPDQIKAPKDQDDSVLPKWAKRKRLKEKKASKKKQKLVRKRSSSLSLPLTSESGSNKEQEMDESYSPARKKPRSAPVSPTEDTANRRHVEDTYSLLSKIPAEKTIITPEGVFIPFKVLASTNTPNVQSVQPKPSTSGSDASQTLPTTLVESLGKLKGSIRIIPGTKPGDPPRIISSLIAVQGRPVQLNCTQSQEELQETSESLENHPRSHEPDGEGEHEECLSEEKADEVEDHAMEYDPVGNPEVENNVFQCHSPGALSPQANTKEFTAELASDEAHTQYSESNNQTKSAQSSNCKTNLSLQNNMNPAGESCSSACEMQPQSKNSASEDQPSTPQEDEVIQISAHSSRPADDVVTDQIQQPEDVSISKGCLVSSPCTETEVDVVSESNETDSVTVGPALAQTTVVEDHIDSENAANQIMSEQMSEQNPMTTDGSETPKETNIPAQEQTPGIETEVDSYLNMPRKCTEGLDLSSPVSSQTPGSEEQVLEEAKSTVPEDSSIDMNTDLVHRNQSAVEIMKNVCSPEQSGENVKSSEMADSVPGSSLGNSEEVFEVSADSAACCAEDDQTEVDTDALHSVQTNEVITVITPPKLSEDPPSSKQDHVSLYPSTPTRVNTREETTDNSKLEFKDSKAAKDNSSPISKNVCESPKVTRTPLEIIAAFCPYYASPSPPVKSPTPQQSLLERTPPKKQSDTVYRELRPKPTCSLSASDGNSPKTVSPFLDKVISKSPKRILRANRTILPKTFVLDNKESPTKRAARSLKKRAQMICQRTSPCKLLPQTEMQRIQRLQLCSLAKPTKVNQSRRKQKTPVRKVLMRPSYKRSNSESEDLSESEEGSSKRSGDSPRVRVGTKRKLSDADKKQEESDVEDAGMSQEDSQNEDEVEDSQNSDQSHLDMLMAASTTLGFGQKKNTSRERVKGKTHKKKEQTLAMLAPDLLEMDPKKDEKDTAFAQAYLDRVRECLTDNLDVYEEFLTLMYNLGKDGQSAIEIYQKMQKLFKDFPELLDEFAGFLLPEQAVVCGCFMKNQETIKARTFLRKLEVNYEKQPNHFQKILKVLTQWYQNPQRSPQDLQTSMKPLLRGMPHLLEQFSLFFPDEKPPESYMNDFETVTLSDSDFEEGASVDSFEEVDFPDEFDTYRTKWCSCDCHQDPNEVKQFKRLKHCFNCSLKVIDGKLYFQPSRNKLYPAKVIVHKSVSPDQGGKSVSAVEMEDDQTADKENLNCLGARPTVISPSASHASPVRPKRIKLKISRKKAGQKRFLTLCEIGGSPSKQEPVTDQDTSEDVMETDAGVTEVAGLSVVATEGRLSPDSSRRDSDALIVNPPVTLQANILQNEKCDLDIAVSSSGSPAMLTSFASLSFPTTSSSITNVCLNVHPIVSETLASPLSTTESLTVMSPVCTVSASKPVGQTAGFLKISPTKGPSCPNVTQLSFGAGKTPSISSSSASVETTKVGGTRVLGTGATLTIGSTISALSGTSVTLTRQDKAATSALTGNTNNIQGLVPVHGTTVPSKEGLTFPNLVPADAVCHNDAITLNSGQQPSTHPTTATSTLSFGSAISVGGSADSGSVPGPGLGMSLLNMLDGSSVQGEASQSCMSDILAKAMKSADINMTDAEISMSMDFMNNFIATNFKHPGSRNASPLKNPPSSGATDTASLQQVPDLTVSLQEHLMKAGIINKSQTSSSETQNNQVQPGQIVPTVSVPLSTMGTVFVTETLPVYTSSVSGVHTQPGGANVSSSIPYTTVNLTGDVGSAVTAASHYIVDPSYNQVQSNSEAVTSTEQVYQYVQPVSEGQFVSNNEQPGTSSVQIVTSNEHIYVQESEQSVTGTVASITPAESSDIPPVPDEQMEVQDESEVDWTKDMDKLCLEMCKRCGSTEETFSQIAEKLKVVTPNEVSARFDKLMHFLSRIDESENDSD